MRILMVRKTNPIHSWEFSVHRHPFKGEIGRVKAYYSPSHYAAVDVNLEVSDNLTVWATRMAILKLEETIIAKAEKAALPYP